jgi:Fe-S cluster biogenesis protein NfuA
MLTHENNLFIRIDKALDTIRPYLQADGGDVEIVDITPEGTLHIRLLGSCQTCAMSTMTMRTGIEKAVLRAVPEVVAVAAI